MLRKDVTFALLDVDGTLTDTEANFLNQPLLDSLKAANITHLCLFSTSYSDLIRNDAAKDPRYARVKLIKELENQGFTVHRVLNPMDAKLNLAPGTYFEEHWKPAYFEYKKLKETQAPDLGKSDENNKAERSLDPLEKMEVFKETDTQLNKGSMYRHTIANIEHLSIDPEIRPGSFVYFEDNEKEIGNVVNANKDLTKSGLNPPPLTCIPIQTSQGKMTAIPIVINARAKEAWERLSSEEKDAFADTYRAEYRASGEAPEEKIITAYGNKLWSELPQKEKDALVKPYITSADVPQNPKEIETYPQRQAAIQARYTNALLEHQLKVGQEVRPVVRPVGPSLLQIDNENQPLLPNLIQQFRQVTDRMDLPKGGMRKLWDAAANAPQQEPGSLGLIWNDMVAICEKLTSTSGQMKTLGKRAPGRALLYRAIVQHQKNMSKNRVKPGITTLEQLMIEQQKQEAIADLERKKNDLPLVGAFNLSPERKIRAYDLLIEKIRDSNINTPLETLIAAGSDTMSTVVTKPNRGTYTLPGTPQATIQHILSDNRGFNRKQATSEKLLIRLRNKAKKAPPHTTLTNLGLLAKAAVEEPQGFLQRQSQFIEEIMQRPGFKNGEIYSEDKKFPGMKFHFYSSKFYPGRYHVDVINLSDAKPGKDGVNVYEILGRWSKDPHGEWRYKVKPKKFGIKMLQDNNPRLPAKHLFSYQENRTVYEHLPFRKMKSPVISGPLLTTTKMKWLPGMTLHNKIPELQGTHDRILACTALLRGIQEQIHDQNFAHLDVKAGNIMTNYSDPNNPIFTFFDFDTSIKTGKRTTYAGSPFYMSPEMERIRHYSGTLQIDEKKDFWSLGIVLLRALFGITSEQIQAYLAKHKTLVFNPTIANVQELLDRDMTDAEIEQLTTLIHPLFYNNKTTLDDRIQAFEDARLQYDRPAVKNAYEVANQARQTLRDMRNNLQIDKFNYQKIYDTIVRPLDILDDADVVSEYVHTLGINSLYNCKTKEAVQDTVQRIIQQFIKNKQSEDPKIKYSYLKFWREVDKSRLTLDQMEELNKTIEQYDNNNRRRLSSDDDNPLIERNVYDTFSQDKRSIYGSISNLMKEIELLPWYSDYLIQKIDDTKGTDLQENYDIYEALSTHLQTELQNDTRPPNLLNDRPNSDYARELTERAIVSLENYLREGMTFNNLHELLIYQQKQDVIQFCQQSCARVSDKAFTDPKQVKEREKWGAYRELSDHLVASLPRKDACLTQVIGEHRRANFSQFAGFFLANVRSIFSNSGRAFNKICQLPDPDPIKMSYGKKLIAGKTEK